MNYQQARVALLFTTMISTFAGCTGDDGKVGAAGTSGADGADGYDVLVAVTNVEANPDATDGVDGCNFGGQLFKTGLDDGEGTANNGVLDADEVDESTFLCNGRDGRAMLAASGRIEPGAYLSLDLTQASENLSYYAQVVVNGQVIDHAEYSQLFSPFISQITVVDSVSIDGDLNVTELNDGNFALLFCGAPLGVDRQDTSTALYYTVIDLAGATTVAPRVLTGIDCDDGWRERTPLVTLANGDILMAVDRDSVAESQDPETGELIPAVPAQVDLRRYDAAGDLISSTRFDDAVSVLDGTYFGLAAIGDGFALLHSTATEIPADPPAQGEEPTYEYALQLDIYNAANTITASQTWAGLGLGSEPAMSVNADGNLNILLEAVSALGGDRWNNYNSETRAMVVAPTGDVVADVLLSNTYSYLNSISQSANGNWLCSFEYGGPDSTAYAVLNSAGELVSASQVYTEHEPTEIASLAFPDGSFGSIFFEDESLVGNLQCVSNEGQRVAPYTQFTGPIGPGYDRHFVKAISNHELMMLFVPYEEQSGVQMLRSARGYLELRVESATEVRLYNWAASAVDAVLSAN
jgi:hypothetical protein